MHSSRIETQTKEKQRTRKKIEKMNRRTKTLMRTPNETKIRKGKERMGKKKKMGKKKHPSSHLSSK